MGVCGFALAVGAAVAITSADTVYVESLGITVPKEKALAIEQSTPPGGEEVSTPGPVPSGEPDAIPAHILPDETPLPISAGALAPTNAWLVSDGQTLVAVYAGADPTDGKVGRFVIVRQDQIAGVQTEDTVDIPESGAVKLTEVPVGADVETSAQTAKLDFVGESGASGSLDLSKDVIVGLK
jgi:hypothetical protein